MRRKLVLLVAEDDPRDLQLFHLALQRGGTVADVHAVTDGEQAIEYLQGTSRYHNRSKHPFPDLLVLDLKMPGMDGLQVLRWLRDHAECNSLPRVMLSGSGLDKDVQEAYRLGVNSYFAKPANFKEFQDLLRLLIDYWTSCRRPEHCQ